MPGGDDPFGAIHGRRRQSRDAQTFPRVSRRTRDGGGGPAAREELIVKTGFFRQKTKSLIGAAQKIVEDYGGEVPSEMEALVKIPGVGRKTANVILGHIHGKPGFVVDTHVRRLTYRLGFTKRTDPAKIEIDMQKILPAADWTPFSMRLILHGRRVCIARKPACEVCTVATVCPKIGVRTAPRG